MRERKKEREMSSGRSSSHVVAHVMGLQVHWVYEKLNGALAVCAHVAGLGQHLGAATIVHALKRSRPAIQYT